LSILRGFPPRQRDALTRFYVHGHSEQEIGSEMQISSEEFRALKREAKRRFEEALKSPPHYV
jgi:DNA-directed RNA polymerase specialized sigma24 family protein